MAYGDFSGGSIFDVAGGAAAPRRSPMGGGAGIYDWLSTVASPDRDRPGPGGKGQPTIFDAATGSGWEGPRSTATVPAIVTEKTGMPTMNQAGVDTGSIKTGWFYVFLDTISIRTGLTEKIATAAWGRVYADSVTKAYVLEGKFPATAPGFDAGDTAQGAANAAVTITPAMTGSTEWVDKHTGLLLCPDWAKKSYDAYRPDKSDPDDISDPKAEAVYDKAKSSSTNNIAQLIGMFGGTQDPILMAVMQGMEGPDVLVKFAMKYLGDRGYRDPEGYYSTWQGMQEVYNFLKQVIRIPTANQVGQGMRTTMGTSGNIFDPMALTMAGLSGAGRGSAWY